MDSEIIDQHLEWVKTIEPRYRYVERQPDELDGFFEVAGTTTGAALGTTVGGAMGGPVGAALGGGLLAAILYKIGKAVDKKLE
jgi:outer membrane lipoprotein SlyB